MAGPRTRFVQAFHARVHWSSPGVFVASFAGLIGVGMVILRLPVSGAGGAHVPLVDALFQSTSAVCVTGLAAIDIGTRLATFGQVTILSLIQLGGLGIMTYSLLLVTFVQRRGSPDQREWLANVITTDRKLPPARMLRWIVFSTFSVEAVGALVLWLAFWRDLGPGEGAYFSVFHAISAYCNAGFSLFSTNLMGYRDDALVNVVVCLLIVIGGLGFIVTFELWRWMTGRRRWFKLLVQTKLMLVMTTVFILGGATIILLFEFSHAFAPFGWKARILGSFFQSITARTAGFNTLDIGRLVTPTLLVLIALMFVGAGSGSCAGGVKLTTFGVLIMMVLSRLKGSPRPQVWHRSVPIATVGRAGALLSGAVLIIMLGTLALHITEGWGLQQGVPRGMFLDLLFETTSAWGTVGLSTGITPRLTSAGKIVLVAVMFIGRVGPLTLVAVLLRRIEQRAGITYPEEDVMVG